MAFVEDFAFPKLNLCYLNVEIPRQRLQIERMYQSALRAGRANHIICYYVCA